MATRLPAHAIGDAAIAFLREYYRELFPAGHGTYSVAWGDCMILDEIAERSGFMALHPLHPLDRHKRILDALGRDPRFTPHLYRVWLGNREGLARLFQYVDPESEVACGAGNGN